MKRSSSASDASSISGTPLPKSPSKRVKTECKAEEEVHDTQMPTQSPKRSRETAGGLSADKREALVAEIFAEGIKALGTANLANKYGVSTNTMKHCIQGGRKGNLRDKAIKAVRGEEE